MTKWTPGPWRVMFGRDNNTTYPTWMSRAERPYQPVLNSGAFSRPASETAVANARLISAAPDLYEALDALLEFHNEGRIPDAATIARAECAILKARGEP